MFIRMQSQKVLGAAETDCVAQPHALGIGKQSWFYSCFLWAIEELVFIFSVSQSFRCSHHLYTKFLIWNPFGFQLVYSHLLYSPVDCSYQTARQQCHHRRSRTTYWSVRSPLQSCWGQRRKIFCKWVWINYTRHARRFAWQVGWLNFKAVCRTFTSASRRTARR